MTILSKNNCGVVGVAGSTVKSQILSGWSQSLEDANRFDFVQISENKSRINMFANPHHKKYDEVILLDGVFLAVRKDVYGKNIFDESIITGYHCYDLDFCLEISKSHQNYIAYGLGLVHYSMGNFDRDWIKTAFKVHCKHSNYLKELSVRIPPEQRKNLEQNLLADYALSALHFAINKRDFSTSSSIIIKYFTKYLKPRNALAIYRRLKTYL